MGSLQEQAYQSAAWPEFYDLMVEHFFGTQPAADAQLFSRTLESILPSFFYTEPITVLDIGAGTGRVILDLLAFISQDGAAKESDYMSVARGGMIGRDYRFVALDNAQPMLDRAVKKIAARKEGRVEFEVDTVCASATQISEHMPPGSIHLALFAAGSICHLTADGEIARFLKELKKILKEDGRAVISILKEFLVSADEKPKDKDVVNNTETLRLPSREMVGQVYVKHPTKQASKGSVRTDSWKFDIETREGTVNESREMSMDVRMLGEDEWATLVCDSGFDVAERVEGDIQDWWVLKKRV